MKGLKKGTAHEVYTPKSEVDICLNCPLSECGKKDCKRFGKEKKKLKGRKGYDDRGEAGIHKASISGLCE